MTFELHIDEHGNVACELGVIAYPWPGMVAGTRDVANIGSLIVVDGVTLFGLEEWEWLYESGGFDLHLTTSEEDARMFLHIYAGNGSWTYELFEAHWRGESPYGVADAVAYLGRWPD